MRRYRWILLGMGLWLAGCAPEYRVYELPAEPSGRETRVAHAVYFKADAPQLREPDLSAFKVVSDTPACGWKWWAASRLKRVARNSNGVSACLSRGISRSRCATLTLRDAASLRVNGW
jgi:hypothetical protein